MSNSKFINNKFVGKIGGKCASDYYNESKLFNGKSVEEQIQLTNRLLSIEEINGVQFTDEFWTKVFLQNDEDEYIGGIKLTLNTSDSLYSETNICQTLEKIGSDILKKDTLKDNPDKIKVYHDVKLYEKMLDEYNELRRLGERSTMVRNGMDNSHSDAIPISELEKSLLIDKKLDSEFTPVLANLMNYKLEKKIDTIKDSELEQLNELYKVRFPIVDMYYQAYKDFKTRYNELTQNPRSEWVHIADKQEKSKARFKKLTSKEKKLKRQLSKHKHMLREDFINCIYAKTRFIMFKSPLKDEGYPSWDEYDEKDVAHVRYALLLPRTNDLQTDTGCIAYDLDNTIAMCEFTDIQLEVLTLYRYGKTQEEISSTLNVSQQMVNRHIDLIVNKIVSKNWELYTDFYYLNICCGTYKICSRCGEIKLIDYFNKNSRRKDGRESFCKQCV